MSKYIVVNDYGHGGTDSGAVSGKHIEKIYNYDTGKATTDELRRHGVEVIETRKKDETLSITQRCNIAKKYKADYMVSIHHNAGGGDRGEAIHSIFGTKGEQLAKKISTELKVVGQSTVKVYDREYNGTDYYGMIRGTTIPTVIVEVAFLDNANDVTICDTLEERKRNGIAIAHGILKQLGVTIKSLTENKPPQNNKQDTWYRAVSGSFKDIRKANQRMSELKVNGFSGVFLDNYVKDGVTYKRVIAGSFRSKSNAEQRIKDMKNKGFDGGFVVAFEK